MARPPTLTIPPITHHTPRLDVEEDVEVQQVQGRGRHEGQERMSGHLRRMLIVNQGRVEGERSLPRHVRDVR